MSAIENLPAPETIEARIIACRDELAALKKLLRASQAARAAEEAKKRRQMEPTPREVGHA
jgi:hypothetical protein